MQKGKWSAAGPYGLDEGEETRWPRKLKFAGKRRIYGSLQDIKGRTKRKFQAEGAAERIYSGSCHSSLFTRKNGEAAQEWTVGGEMDTAIRSAVETGGV